MQEKKCKGCSEIKNLDFFPSLPLGKFGTRARCKPCHRQYANNKKRDMDYDVSLLERKCYSCRLVKPASEFNKNRFNRGGLRYSCKECDIQSRKKYKDKNGLRLAHLRLKRLYGISLDHFIFLREKQSNRCAICDSTGNDNERTLKTSLVVDHCHKTGLVRALLCHQCNQALGLLRESQRIMESAINYIKEFSSGDER